MAIVTLGSYLSQVKTPRAAVVPYIFKDGELYFLLGQDRQSGDITDLGGGVKKHESTLAAAIREFDEESDEILGHLKANDIICSVALLNKQMGVLFVPLHEKWYEDAPLLFEARKRFPRKKSHSEVNHLIWFSEAEFSEVVTPKALSKKKMWKKLRSFYSQGFGAKLRDALCLAYPNHTRIMIGG